MDVSYGSWSVDASNSPFGDAPITCNHSDVNPVVHGPAEHLDTGGEMHARVGAGDCGSLVPAFIVDSARLTCLMVTA